MLPTTPVGWLAILGFGAFSLVWAPEPAFPHQVRLGRLTLGSDRPFPPAAGRALLADVERRLAASPLHDPGRRQRAFVCQTRATERFFFNRAYGAAGVCHVPVPPAFVRRADIAGDRLMQPRGGAPVPPPRTLAYYVAHELAHDLTGARAGAWRYHQLPRWLREGLADHAARQGTYEVGALRAAWLAGAPELDPARSGRYDRHLLLVAWCLDVERRSLDALLADPPAEAALEAAIRAGR